MASSSGDRIIVLVDIDSFYVQVEQNLCPEYQNKPCAVVEYKTCIVAVNYEARAKGVTRFLRSNEALQKCPDIHFFSVPEIRGKPDLSRYREAGSAVLDVLCEYSDCVEKASIDEAYLDMTSVVSSRMQNIPLVTADQLPNTYVVGWEGESPESRKNELQTWLKVIYEEEHLYCDRMLAVTAVIVEEMRASIYRKTGYRCSAGIAHNKMLAKLSSGINKPDKQTVLPQSSIQLLFKTIPIKKVRNLGGKLGRTIVKKYKVENMGDLIDVPRSQFVNTFGEKTGHWLYNLVRGIENEPVISRQLPKSIGCGKNFPGNSPLSTRNEVTHWLKQLASELEERLIKDENINKRFARLLTVGIRNCTSNGYPLVTRSCPIHVYNAEKLAHDALVAISKLNTSSSETVWKPSIHTLSIVASKFDDKLDNSCCNIQSYLIDNASSGRKEVVCGEQESTLSISIAPVSGKCNTATAESLNTSFLKSAKNTGNSNKSITSFFARKQMAETESIEIDNIRQSSVKKDQNLYRNSSEYLTVGDKDLTGTADKFNMTEICIDEDSKNLKQVKAIGFFTKKLAECSDFNFTDYEIAQDMVSMNNEQLNKRNGGAFLKTYNESLPSTSSVSDICIDLDPELTKLCNICNKHIPVWEETEHLDYHMALNLSNELSKPVLNNSPLIGKSSAMGKSTTVSKSKVARRKRGSVFKSSSQAKKSSVQKNTLDAFVK